MINLKPGVADMFEKLIKGIAASGAEAHDSPAVGCQMGGKAFQHIDFGLGGEKGHDIARTHDQIEGLRDTSGTEIEFGEIADEPCRAGVIVFGRLDQRWIDIDADNDVATAMEFAAHSTRPTARIENAGTSGHHGVDQACFSGKIRALCGHRAKPFDIPR